MFLFIKYFTFFVFINELNSNFIYNQINYSHNNNSSFIIFFIIFLCFNFFLNQNQNHRLDLDLLFKFIILFIKTPNFLINYFINISKKIFYFLFFFKYRQIINIINISSKNFLRSFFILWRPLFKKTSYFGYYRSNRSKWIK